MLISRDGTRRENDGQLIDYTEKTSLDLYDLIEYLKKKNFFPEVHEGSVWSISYEGEEFGLYKPPKSYSYSYRKIKSLCAEDCGIIHFKFFLNGEERAEYLFRTYFGNKKDMYYDGYMDEYLSYGISKEIELKWREVLIKEKNYQNFDETENIKEAVSFLRNVIERPGIYVGGNRLDLVQIFYDGWCMHQKTLWSISYDLKRWMFIRESVSCSSSLNGWSMFYETYGVTDTAIIQFREFMEMNTPTSVFDYGRWDTVTEHISSIWFPALHLEVPELGLKPYLDFSHDENTSEEDEYLELLRQIKRIVDGDCLRLKIFLNLGRAVLQVRFFFDDGSGWKDGVSLNTTLGYYEKLVVLHGYVKLMDIERNNASIMTIDWSKERMQVSCEEYQAPEFHFRYEIPPKDEYLISHQFLDWKLKEIKI